MKKKVLAGILALLLLCLGGYAAYWHQMQNRVNSVQPLRIMVDGTRYVICGGVKAQPDSPPDGTITEVIDSKDHPEKDGQANFGSVGMPYWKIGDQVVVEASQYYLFNES